MGLGPGVFFFLFFHFIWPIKFDDRPIWFMVQTVTACATHNMRTTIMESKTVFPYMQHEMRFYLYRTGNTLYMGTGLCAEEAKTNRTWATTRYSRLLCRRIRFGASPDGNYAVEVIARDMMGMYCWREVWQNANLQFTWRMSKYCWLNTPSKDLSHHDRILNPTFASHAAIQIQEPTMF